MKRDKKMTPENFFELVKYIENNFPFLGPLIIALGTGRESKVEFECQELEKRINGQKIRELEEEIRGLEESIRILEEREGDEQEREKELQASLAALNKENQVLKSKLKVQVPPNPFKYLLLWLFRKNSKFEILFLPKGKKETD